MGKTAFITGLLLLSLLQVKGQTPPVPVKSPNTRYQLEREVITRWGKFNPRWYFVLFHNKYRKGPDRRNMKQLLPVMAATKINLSQAEQEDSKVTENRDQELFKMADRTLNKSYNHFYKNKIDVLNTRILFLHVEATDVGVGLELLLALRAEHDRLNADVELTKEAYQDDAKKAKQFQTALENLAALRSDYLRTIAFYKIMLKHSKK